MSKELQCSACGFISTSVGDCYNCILCEECCSCEECTGCGDNVDSICSECNLCEDCCEDDHIEDDSNDELSDLISHDNMNFNDIEDDKDFKSVLNKDNILFDDGFKEDDEEEY